MKTVFLALTTVLFLGTVVQAVQEEEGLVLYLAFDEGEGDTAEDLSGHENNGSIIGGAEWVKGKDKNALEFDGKDDYVEVPYKEMFNITHTITLAAWVKPAMVPFTGSRCRGIINGKKSKHGPYLLQMCGSGCDIGFWLGGNWISVISRPILDTQNFWHLVGTYEEDVGLKIYVNGELDIERGGQGPIEENVKEGVVIGHNYGIISHSFEGIIDEVVIYNKVLTEEEIKALYEGEVKAELAAMPTTGMLTTTWAIIKSH